MDMGISEYDHGYMDMDISEYDKTTPTNII